MQLSCGIVMDTKLFTSHRYRNALLAHGATIIPFISGMFISGLLYGQYLIHSETPKIDSIEQLEQSHLTLCAPILKDSDNFAKYLLNILIEEVLKLHIDLFQSQQCVYI